MLELLKRLFSPEYLVVSQPGPLGRAWLLYAALGLLFALGCGAALCLLLGPGRHQRPAGQRAWAWFELWVCLFGLGTVAGRFLGWPGWSARIWPYSLALLAVGGTLIYPFRRAKLPPWLAYQLRVLAFQPLPRPADGDQGAGPARWLFVAFGLLVHLLGLALILGTRYRLPLWLAPILLLGLVALQAPRLSRHRPPPLAGLTPLLGAYAATLLWLLYQGLGITVIGWQGLAFPNPLLSLFYVDGIILALSTYTLLCQLGLASQERAKPGLLWRGAAVALLLVTLSWAGVVYFGKRTHGATASDPFAYAQMGVDLAERGTFLHRYSLFQDVMPLGIAWAPLQPVGYHIPRNALGDCPSVWATGASALLALGYLLLGEVGLYVTTPFVALLALPATWALVQETLRGEPKAVRYVTAALTIALLATSPEHVDRLLVPMADAPAQLFTVLTLLFALRGMRQLREGRESRWSYLLAGVALAWAYWVRHTQLVLVLPVLLSLLLAGRAARRKAPQALILFFGAALLAALPDIIYRWRVFGGPLATETTELHLMGLEHIGLVAWQMLRDALVAGEWGYLFPLALYGGYRLARDRWREAAILGSAFAAVLLLHLTYRSLRLRDLISLFPLLDLAVAYGAVVLVRRVRALADDPERRAQLGTSLLAAVTIAWIVLSLALARWAMIDNLWKRGWASFGYMRAEQRASFDRLAELTPSRGVIGASLNAGAIMMYTDRDAIRPYDSWTQEEWDTFVQAMQDLGRPVYLLDDGGLMSQFIAGQGAHYQLTPIEDLSIPLFYARDRESGWLYRLEGRK